MSQNKRSWPTGLGILTLVATMGLLGCPQQAPPPAPPSPTSKAAPKAPAKPDESATKAVPKASEAKAPATDAAALPKAPLGMDPPVIPEDNPMTVEKVELGKLLFFDKRLSGDNTISCSFCHNPQTAWTLHRANAVGIKNQEGERNIPSIINAAHYKEHFWDGRARGLEAQAVGPIQNPIEMGQNLDDLVAELAKVPAYVEKFKKVFGSEITKDNLAKALAAFERTILSGNSPYDKYKAGDEKALNEAQKRGLELFEKAGCSACHSPPLFSNHSYQNAGVGMDAKKVDEGRKAVTKKDSDLGKFRVPELREVPKTHPYFHNGSGKTLEDAVALMASGGKDNPNLSITLKAVREAKLTEKDRQDIIEFLKALQGDFPVIDPPQLP